jgi:hypothetical protein
MSTIAPIALTAPRLTTATCTITSVVRAHGHSVEQTQYATPTYVATEIGRATLLFIRGLGDRFIVDRVKRQLIRSRSDAQKRQLQQIRSLIGAIEMIRDERPSIVDGYECRSIRVQNEDAQLVLSIETYCTRIEGLEETALHAEREFDADRQPFSLPLRDNEVVVRSTTRALAASFGQSQTIHLLDVSDRIADAWRITEMLDYPIVDR